MWWCIRRCCIAKRGIRIFVLGISYSLPSGGFIVLPLPPPFKVLLSPQNFKTPSAGYASPFAANIDNLNNSLFVNGFARSSNTPGSHSAISCIKMKAPQSWELKDHENRFEDMVEVALLRKRDILAHIFNLRSSA